MASELHDNSINMVGCHPPNTVLQDRHPPLTWLGAMCLVAKGQVAHELRQSVEPASAGPWS